MSMMEGDILKYMPTSTVGKVTEIRNRDGKIWVKLDFTNLYYDASYLVPADVSEYREVSFKERERSSEDYKKTGNSPQDSDEMEKDVDIGGYMPSGGG